MTRFRLHRRQQMAISEAELASLTNDMADAHRDTIPTLRSSLAGWEIAPSDDREAESRGLSRRSFLLGGGALAAGGLLMAACGSKSSASNSTSTSGAMAPSSSKPSLDVTVAALAASLEVLAVSTYASGLSAATAGKLGTVPPAVATFAETAMAQHKDHAAAWNSVVESAGYKKITAPNAKIAPSINAAFSKVHDVAGLANLALSLEDAAAATYLEAIGVVTGTKAIETAATIQPVEMQHAAILNFVLGKYPVPAAFAPVTGAAPATDAPALVKA